jgi:anti-anti-sigma factor
VNDAPFSGVEFDVWESSTDALIVLAVRGELDAVSAPRLAEAIGNSLARGAPSLIVDLSDLNFLGSAGMTVLLDGHAVAESRSQWFGVVADGPGTSRPIKVIGLDRELRLYSTVEAARTNVP